MSDTAQQCTGTDLLELKQAAPGYLIFQDAGPAFAEHLEHCII